MENRIFFQANDETLAKETTCKKTAVVLLYAGWCHYSQIALEVVSEIIKKYGDRIKIIQVEVEKEMDVKENPVIYEMAKIEKYPAWLFYRNGVYLKKIETDFFREDQLKKIEEIIEEILN